jgi:hypothetical protein
VQRTEDGKAQVGYSLVGRSRGRVMLCAVCTVHQEMRSAGFLAWPEYQGRRFSWLGLKTCGFGFFGLGLKTGSFGLVMRATKSPRRFLDLGLKTKWATVYRLHHKTDGRMKTTWDARRDLAACFAWKQVGLEFPSLASRLQRRGAYGARDIITEVA